jgi:hypothetical protein
MFHERHFNAVKVFLEDAFPGCTATLQAREQPILPDFRVALGGGYASIAGLSGGFLQAGLKIGIPLDRLRHWEVILGPQMTYMLVDGDDQLRNAFLLGARFGLEGSTGGTGHGFTAEAFGEAGYGRFSSSYYQPSGFVTLNAEAPYGEVGLNAGYRSPFYGPATQLDVRAEGAAGAALGTPGIIGPPTLDSESDPARSYWFRLGVTAATHF